VFFCLLLISILSVLGENVQEPYSYMSLTRHILNRMMQAKPEKWCRDIYLETTCDPMFRKLALDKSDYDNNFGDFAIQYDDNGIDIITAMFSIERDPLSEERSRLLAKNDLRTFLIIRGKGIKDFETKFNFKYNEEGVKIAFDYYTQCYTEYYANKGKNKIIYDTTYIIYTCSTKLSYKEFIKEITNV
jgi:hypothetical protein